MQFPDKLKNYKRRIDPLITKYLEEKINKYQKIFPESLLLFDQIKDLTLRGGDRIRPVLFCLGFQLIRQPSKEEEIELFRLSTALEFFHSFALIHDDIIDGSLLRRAGPSVHERLSEVFGNGWGMKLAILVGDLAEIFSSEIFQSNLFPSINMKKAIDLFVEMKEEVIVGEYIDTVMPLKSLLPSEVTVKKMLSFKSGFYSVQKPLLMGAVLAGIDKKSFRILSVIGSKLGLVFQIKDDILGVFGEKKVIGKSVLTDLREGKRTLLITETVRSLKTNNEKSKFLNMLNEDLRETDSLQIKKQMKESGALDYCHGECIRLKTESLALLERMGLRQETTRFMKDLANFFIIRDN